MKTFQTTIVKEERDEYLKALEAELKKISPPTTFYVDDRMGTFYYEKDQNTTIIATPFWEDSDKIPFEIYTQETNLSNIENGFLNTNITGNTETDAKAWLYAIVELITKNNL